MLERLPKSQNLILLIGENPLPNYVAAKLLVDKGTVHLAHTNGTQRQARQLRQVLEKEQINCQDLPLGSSESNASAIRDGIQKRIRQLNDSTIGLHYTGGTKAMAIHAYQVLKEHDSTACFSYLDPRHLELCIDQRSGDLKRYKITSDMLQVNISSLMELHGWETQSAPTNSPLSLCAAIAFMRFHQDKCAADEWRKWCDFNLKNQGSWKEKRILKEMNISGDKFLKSPNDSRETTSANNTFDISQHEKIIDALRLLGIENGLCIQEIKVFGGFQKPEHVWKWLDGVWLEHYVLDQVQQIAHEQKIFDSATSFNIRNPTQTDSSKFEVDVLFTRGYQLFAVSCTTSDNRGLCKSKLFEAYIRAQQLGGAEARVALVCCADPVDTAALKTQIVNIFTPIGLEPDDYRIEVFGREDLPNLSAKISQWIKNVDRDE
jgi:Domain of unknown function (DUF1887)